MLPEGINTAVEVRLGHEQFRLKTQQQLVKDFAIYGFEFETSFTSESWEADKIVETVSAALMYMIEKDSSNWHPLLYTMDIPEQTYLRLATSGETDWLIAFTWIVIRREAQKVFFREKYA